MASQSLYRKWRSQTFSDLIGQEAVTRTLLNAVREGRIAQAYLFCGPRGTGKTSAARLLAKAVNCANPNNGEPCNECVSCREITAGHSPDVIEIDAASNNSVDDIRSLRETASLMGSGGRYKLYIIDETHMLSTAAFNALLKTIEEPPPHVIFVLATTESHKVLATIVSRCQRFDFHRFSMRDLIARLQHVAQGEDITLDPAAADLLARAAQGGMRDALSLLDQAVAFCGPQVDLDRTRAMLGLADPAAIRALLEHVAEQRSAEGLHQIHALVETGADLRQAQLQLAEEWRALLLARAGADVATVMDRGDDEAREIATLARSFSLEELMACARVFARMEAPARGLPVPQLALELMFLECVSIRRHGGAPSAQVAPTSTQAIPTAAPAARQPAPPPSQLSDQTSAAPPTRQPQSLPSTPPPPAAPNTTHRATEDAEELDLDAIERGDAPPPAPRGTPYLTLVPTASDAATSDTAISEEAPRDTRASAAPAPGVRARGAWDERLAEVQRQWAMIRKVCLQKGRKVAALLNAAEPVRLETGEKPTLILAVSHQFHLEKLREPASREIIEWAVEQVLETPMRVRLALADATATNGNGPAAATRNGASNSTPRGAASATMSTSAAPSASETPAPRAAPAAAQPATPASTPPPTTSAELRVRDAQPAYRADVPAAAQPSSAPPSALEAEIRADPIIQEILRTCGTELAEVRALEADEGE